MPQRDVRPEFTDTAGHAIGVVVEFLLPRERDARAGVGVSKSLQIQRLSADDDVEHTPDALLVRRGKLLEIGHRRSGVFQQLCLVWVLLQPGEHGQVGHRSAPALQPVVVLLERLEPLACRAAGGVGDRVRDARQQIAQSDLGPHWRR